MVDNKVNWNRLYLWPNLMYSKSMPIEATHVWHMRKGSQDERCKEGDVQKCSQMHIIFKKMRAHNILDLLRRFGKILKSDTTLEAIQ